MKRVTNKAIASTTELQGARKGYTLIELVSSLVTASVLIGGLGSAIKLATLAAPQSQNATSCALSAADAMEMLANDLRYATTVTNQSATQITITVPDRDGLSPLTETITYSWSGIAGAPLVRTFNATSSNVATDVREFSLIGHNRVVTMPTSYSDSAEVLLTSFSNPENATTTDWSVASKAWIGEYVLPILPSALSWKITKVKFNAKQNGTNSGTTLVEIRSASGGLPTTTVLDSQSMLENTLTTPGYSQKTFSFANVPDTAVGTGLCIVLKFSVSSPSCFVQYLATGASSGSNTLVSTTNSDPGWTAGAGKSMLFEAWGTYRTQNAQAYQYFLQDMRCALRTGASSVGRVEKSVRVLNEPQVGGP